MPWNARELLGKLKETLKHCQFNMSVKVAPRSVWRCSLGALLFASCEVPLPATPGTELQRAARCQWPHLHFSVQTFFLTNTCLLLVASSYY